MQEFQIKEHLILSYQELEKKNLAMKRHRAKRTPESTVKKEMVAYLKKEEKIKAVTVCFTDIEGKLLRLDYDKDFFIASEDNLTFDGSSIRGFTTQDKSDLRLGVDWRSFRWLPSDIFGPGKLIVFANVLDKDKTIFEGDFRARLQEMSEELYKKEKITCNVACEVEGMLLKGVNAEQEFDERKGLELATSSGYFHSLPQDELRQFIDTVAEAKRSMGFENEKDHPEVAPSQFELNYKYADILEAADNVQLYKLICKQVAKQMGLTATFLPKPVMNVNGSGMHTNMSLSKNGKNIFFDKKGEMNLSKPAHEFLTGILHFAKDMCLVLNSSVNSYRRLDPAYEAPNEIKVHSCDRGSMIRVPIGNEKSARIEVRSVAPDCSPYLVMFTLLSAGTHAINAPAKEKKTFENVLTKREKLPGNIYDALRYFKQSKFMEDILGKNNHKKYADVKETAANRSPKDLGKTIKNGEILYHHEVTNQDIWSRF